MENVVTSGQFRFAYFTPLFDVTVAFYRDGLDLPVIEAWDRSPEDRGTLFAAASGLIEVLALPRDQSDHLFDERPPQGACRGMEGHEVAARYQRIKEKGLVIHQELKDQACGHRSFCVRDPNGLTIYFFSESGKRSK